MTTIADIHKALLRAPDTGEFLDPIAAMELNSQFVTLYDPAIDGVTPLDGAGNPSTSVVGASQALAALAKGFTEEPAKKRPASRE